MTPSFHQTRMLGGSSLGSVSLNQLRRNQIDEVLNYDKLISQQLFKRTKDAQVNFEENIKPQSQRDLQTEISVEKLVEKLNEILNKKINELDNYDNNIQNIRRLSRDLGYSDFIIAYNNIMREYTRAGLSDNTKRQILLKMQYHMKALKIRETKLGKDHPHTGTCIIISQVFIKIKENKMRPFSIV